MPPVGAEPDLITQLSERRSQLIAANRELLSAAQTAGRATNADEDTRYDANMTEIRALNGRLDDLADQAAREQRGAAARATGSTEPADDGGRGARQTAGAQVTEPQVYGRFSQNSYFTDLLADATGRDGKAVNLSQARERLSRHRDELAVEMPARTERRMQRASRQLDAELERSVRSLPSALRKREERMIDRWLGLGIPTMERRAINQTQGTGGYFVPPLWLIDEYTPYLRAGRVLANLCNSMDLPAGTNSINLPIISTGTATGPQTADGQSVPGRDLADNFVNALVKTVAGQEDASLQLLELSPINMDQVLFKDLTADHAMQVDGLVLLGSGSSGQITGMYSHGTITGGSTEGIIVNGVTGTTTSQWVGASSFYQGAGMLMSQISRKRYAPVTAVCSNPAVWYAMATAGDGNSRPLVVPSIQGPFNTIADMEGTGAEGLVGSILGRPWYIDNNIPLTFGGASTNPSMSTVSAGHVSPTDGTGSGDNFTPFIGGVWDDLLLFEGEVRTRVLQEVLSGTLQIRFQIYSYIAFIPNRYQGSSSQAVSYGNANSGTTAGAALSTGSSGGLVGF